MSEIRVTYSGLISFVMGIANILLALLFMLVVTRTLTSTEFGTWGLISNLLFYVIIGEPIISYWVTRETARNINSGKTAILSSGIVSIAGIFIYILISYLVGHQTNVNLSMLFFAAILIPTMFLNNTLTAINTGWKPHAISYGAFSFVISQIILALIFIYFLGMGLLGLILTVEIAYFTSIIVLIIYARDKIKNHFNKEFLKKWLKHFWIPLYPGISSMIYSLDVVIFSVITGSVVGIAFWSASKGVTMLISQAGSISKAVYPKLLQMDNHEYLKENFTQVFYFGIPLVSMIIIFARPALFALNPSYETATPIVVILGIQIFLNMLSGLLQLCLWGIEKVDLNEESAFKDYVKSKLFSTPTIVLIQSSIYVCFLAIGLMMLSPSHSQLDLLIYWSIIGLVIQIPFTIYFYLSVKKHLSLTMDSLTILKYLLISTVIFVITFILMNHFLVYKKNIFEFIPNLLLYVGLGVGGYLIITYLVDLRTKKLFHAIIQEIYSKKS